MTFEIRPCWAPGAVLKVATALMVVSATGCTSVPRLDVEARRYRLDVRMDPVSHELVGRTVLKLARRDATGSLSARAVMDNTGGQAASGTRVGGPVAVELLLHPDLEITSVSADGATIKRRSARRIKAAKGDDFTPRTHVIVLEEAVDALTLNVEYSGILLQDVSAGEKEGQIHNFQMRAHIGEDGIYLGGGNWYPQPAEDDDAPPHLTHFTVIANPVPGFELVAGATRDAALSDLTGKIAWRTPYPMDGMVLVGGRHDVYRQEHGGRTISLHLKESQAQHAEGLFEAVRRNLDRYEPLIGPYPADEFAIVDNFFSSGFAFPTFTLLSSAVIDMGQRSQTSHGYIDHEMLHCWWGNGVHVDSRDGNWCEALASYGANYYGFILDSDEEEARRKRRNFSHFLSRIKPDKDKPLGTFGKKDGCGRGIAYSKGAAVFHMLARKIGQENFWSAMRRFTAEYVGTAASWEDIRRVCERESEMSLTTFFDQWIRRGAAPSLKIEAARFNSAEQTLTVSLSQGEPAFELDVPIRIVHADGVLDINVPLATEAEDVTIPVNAIPLSVEVDPDYHIFRKVPLDQIVPTTAKTRYGKAFATVLPQGDVPEPYTKLKSTFESSFEDEDDEVRELRVGEIEDGALDESCLLIVGEAVKDPQIAAFLNSIAFPVRWNDDGFELEGVLYTDPSDAVVGTTSHPGVVGGGVTVFYANSGEALPAAMLIPFYDHSVVIFQDRKAAVRHDVEHRAIVKIGE